MKENSSQARNNRILLIDDNPMIHEDFLKILCSPANSPGALDGLMEQVFGESEKKQVQIEFEVASVFQGDEGLQKVERSLAAGRPYAVAFVDLRMPPGWDGVKTISEIWARDPALQVVICTAYSDYSWQEIIARLGSSDQLVILKKPFDSIEVLQLAHAMTQKWEMTRLAGQKMADLEKIVAERTKDLRSANEHLRSEMVRRGWVQNLLMKTERHLSCALDACLLPIAILSARDQHCVEMNQAFVDTMGKTREELIGVSLWASHIKLDGEKQFAMMDELAQGRPVERQSCRLFCATKEGTEGTDALIWIGHFNLDPEPYLLLLLQEQVSTAAA